MGVALPQWFSSGEHYAAQALARRTHRVKGEEADFSTFSQMGDRQFVGTDANTKNGTMTALLGLRIVRVNDDALARRGRGGFASETRRRKVHG